MATANVTDEEDNDGGTHRKLQQRHAHVTDPKSEVGKACHTGRYQSNQNKYACKIFHILLGYAIALAYDTKKALRASS